MNRYSKALRILSPKGQIEDKPFLAVKIVKGEHYSRPVMEKEIKEYIKQTFKKSNQYRYREDNWLETLVESKETEFDRKEIEKEIKLRRLYEQMTTANMMTTTIQGEGETDIESIDGSVAASYSPLSGEDSAFVDTAITASGTGSGSEGGFDLGQDYLAFNGEGTPRYAVLDAIDSTELDTIVITAIRGNDSNGGEDPDEAGEELKVWGQHSGAPAIEMGTIIPLGSDSSGLKNWSLAIPEGLRNASTKFILRQETHSGSGFDHYGVTEIKFQRRSPMNVVVSLDSPEASAFIRTGGGGTTEKKKKKKVQDILDGSDAYLENQFGSDFPGTSPREVGQEEPQPGIGKFEPEVIDYETWKNELEKSDDPEVKKILKGDSKKTFDKFVDDNPEVAAQSVLNDILKGKSVKNQLSQLPQEVQDNIISKAVESVLLGEVNVELSQLPQEVQDVLITNPEYMTNERIDNLVNDDKMVGDILNSMWEKDEKLFNNVATEVEELPYHQKVKELENILSGAKYEGDEGFVDYGSRSGSVLSNMSPLEYDRWAPYHALRLKYYGTGDYEGSRYGDGNTPDDYVFNDGLWSKDPFFEKIYGRETPVDLSVGAPGSPLRELSQPYLDAYKEFADYWEKYPRTWHKKQEKKYKNFTDYSNRTSNPLYPGWKKWQDVQSKGYDLGEKMKEERNKANKHYQRLDKELTNLNKKLEAEYDKKREQIEKKIEGSMDIFMQDFIKMFIMQYSGNTSSNYSFGGPDLGDIAASPEGYQDPDSYVPGNIIPIRTPGHNYGDDEGFELIDPFPDGKPGLARNGLSGSAGEIAGVDADTAASTAAQTQQKDKDKGNKGGNISGSNLTAAKEQELLQLAKMIDRKGTNVAAVGVAAGMMAAPLAQQVIQWIGLGLSAAVIMSRMKSQSGSSYNPISASGDIDWNTHLQDDPIPSGEALPGAKDLTPQQKAEVDAANKELKDARTALDNLPSNASDSQRDRAEERLDRANKNRIRIRKKNRTDNQSRNENYEPQGNPLMEKKKFDAVEPKEHKSGSMRIKSPQQFFNPADVKPEYPKDPPPEMINGYHPKLADGQEIAKRFNKLDPQSAKAMPKTGNPHIDAKVEKAKNNPDKDGPAHRQNVFAKIKKARLQKG